jgi:predicted RNA-binding Zn ribbon-like protein
MSGGWVWDGGRLSVDLLNTVRDRVKCARETLRSPADLEAWLREAGLPCRATEDDLVAARRLRDAIDAALSDPVPAAAVEVINVFAGALAPRLVLGSDGRPALDDLDARGALARVAADAIDLLTGEELERVRCCAAGDCGIRFVDRSPARNRQWCSMRRCGNRSKARRHYARRR